METSVLGCVHSSLKSFFGKNCNRVFSVFSRTLYEGSQLSFSSLIAFSGLQLFDWTIHGRRFIGYIIQLSGYIDELVY